MKLIRTLLLRLLLFCSSKQSLFAQCPSSYNQVTLNWDHLDFLVNSGSYGYLHDEDLAYHQHCMATAMSTPPSRVIKDQLIPV